MFDDLANLFPSYRYYDPQVPVYCVTPHTGRTIHRFFDTSPFSPSGRFLGLTRLPFEDRLPSPGDVAEIVVVDLATGTERVVADSRGWDTQLGAQVQWGRTDAELLFNDLDTATWEPFGISLDPFSGARRSLEGPIYMVSPDGKWAASPCLLRTGATQPGYGVIVPSGRIPANRGAPVDDGVYLTNIDSGKCKLHVSLEKIAAATIGLADQDEFADGDFYCFHVKWSPTGDRLMLVLRWVPRHKGALTRSQVVTMNADGGEIRVAIPAREWDKGGHHPNWCPDGSSLIMNLAVSSNKASPPYRRLLRSAHSLVTGKSYIQDMELRFIRARYDGGYEVLARTVQGSGHPTMHPNGRLIVTDAYPEEQVAFADGTVPIRLIDLEQGTEVNLIRIRTDGIYRGPRGEMRVDPHPAWDREFRRLAFNASVDGTRRVYVADLTSVLP